MWSYGCVLAELLLGSPMFPSATGADHLVEIIKVLGSPSQSDLKKMNPNYQEFQFPNIHPHVLSSLFPPKTNKDAIDIVQVLLKYDPEVRPSAMEVVILPFLLPTLARSSYRMPERKSEKIPRSFLMFTADEKRVAMDVGEGCKDTLLAAEAAAMSES